MAAAGPGAAGAARVSSGRELSCVPEVAGALAAVARQGFDFLCLPLFHPRHRREFTREPARSRPGPQTRSDLLLSGRDWNTLIVGKLSPWIRPDSPLEHVRLNSQAALGRVGGLLSALGGRRGPWAQLERRGAEYLQGKAVALLLRCRLEELTVLLDTYPPHTLRAHRCIRAGLEEALGVAKQEAEQLRAGLEAFQALGPAFAALASEYGRLQELLRQRRWALRQLRPPPP